MEYVEISAKDYKALPTTDGTYKVLYSINGRIGIIYKKDGKTHRVGAPAAFWDSGGSPWYFEGSEHRIDGPSTTWPNGGKEWYLFGTKYSKEKWFEQLTPEQKALALANPENF